MKPEGAEGRAVLRCAVYTRKSSDEGLDQPFNSLHAQREACEAYALSQAGEGWVALPTAYDDGGWSGGAMDRPALRRLLCDVESGLVEIVVVYKVDRLTRSLADFAKIVETLDRHGASFVSVTQAFNTTTSMGRLTLNVLLSFAQFEREVTGERIRDKIAASKAKGMWMGGTLPLGYDPPLDPVTRALVVNAAEAEQVRTIFDQYLKLRSVHELQAWLKARGIRSKRWTSTRGRDIGGVDFSRGALFHLLSNRTYLGEIRHKDRSYPGAHPAIVDPQVFAAVGAKLSAASRRNGSRSHRAAEMTLKGLLFDGEGARMGPTFAYGRTKKLYRYYVAETVGREVDADEERIRRAPAEAVERLVHGVVERLARTSLSPHSAADLQEYVARVELHPTSVQIVLRREALFAVRSDPEQQLATLTRRLEPGETLRPEEAGEGRLRMTIPCRLQVRGGRTWLALPSGATASAAQVDGVLVSALRSAHVMLSELSGAPVGSPQTALLSRAPANRYDRRLLRLAFLAPDIQRAILEGRQPASLMLQQLVLGRIPASWNEQRTVFS